MVQKNSRERTRQYRVLYQSRQYRIREAESQAEKEEAGQRTSQRVVPEWWCDNLGREGGSGVRRESNQDR